MIPTGIGLLLLLLALFVFGRGPSPYTFPCLVIGILLYGLGMQSAFSGDYGPSGNGI